MEPAHSISSPKTVSLTKPNSETGVLQQEGRDDGDFQRLQNELQQMRLQHIFMDQQQRPLTLHKLRLHGANNTRRNFLEPILSPILFSDAETGSVMGDVLFRVRTATDKLQRLGIFHPEPQVWMSNVDAASDPSSTPTDADIDIRVRELGRFRLNTGTDIGNGEGSAFGSLLWRNVFGGAELLSLNASAGTRTRSAYRASLSAPVLSNPDMRVAVDALASSTAKPWASHEEAIKGGTLRFLWTPSQTDTHELEYSGQWRQVTGLVGSASSTVRADAGDSMKSSIRHTFQRDCRDNPHLPQSGYLAKSMIEIAGIGPLGGDVAFAKGEIDLGGAIPVSLPGVESRSGISFGGGLRLGMLYPLAPGRASGNIPPSRINDRFQLGGPTDIRGFQLGGIGPRDNRDAVGGDLFTAAGVNMLFPLPYSGPHSSLRCQVFANGGRLIGLKSKTGKGLDWDSEAVRKRMRLAIYDLFDGLPSLAAGIGLVYAHPVARFELNFSLPLILRRGEESVKGLQVGVGINFL